MPLDRAHTTIAIRIMLPTYVLFFTILGVTYTRTDPTRLAASPALAFAAHRFPMPVWGCMFFACALLVAIALAGRNTSWSRRTASYALWVSIVCNVVWALIFAAAAFLSQTSPAAWAWPSFVAIACYASYRSLAKGEKDCP